MFFFHTLDHLQWVILQEFLVAMIVRIFESQRDIVLFCHEIFLAINVILVDIAVEKMSANAFLSSKAQVWLKIAV